MKKTYAILLAIVILSGCANGPHEDIESIIRDNKKEVDELTRVIDSQLPVLNKINDDIRNERLSRIQLTSTGVILTLAKEPLTSPTIKTEEVLSLFTKFGFRDIGAQGPESIFYRNIGQPYLISDLLGGTPEAGEQISTMGIVLMNYKGFAVVMPCNRSICIVKGYSAISEKCFSDVATEDDLRTGICKYKIRIKKEQLGN